jgi:hypothetical protein
MMKPSRVVLHPAFVTTRGKLYRAIKEATPGQIIAVIGLAGSGKSEIGLGAMQHFFGDVSIWGDGLLPAAFVLATPSERGLYNSKEFASRLLQSVQDPTLDWLKPRSDIDDPGILHTIAKTKLESDFWKKKHKDTTEPMMLRQFVESAKARRLKVLFIEQAGSMAHVKGKQSPSDHMATLMCVAMDAGIVVVLFGVPKSSALWLGNEEVSRRTDVITLDRYRFSRKEDREVVYRILLNLQPGLTSAERKLLFGNLELVFSTTLGIFDELHHFLKRAMQARDEGQSTALSIAHLEAAIHPKVRLESIYSSATLLESITKACEAAVAKALMHESLKEV